MANQEPFFIGWQATTPKPLAGFVRTITILAILVGVTIAGLAAALQRTVGPGTWDFTESTYTGLFLATPAPMLIVEENGKSQLHFLVKTYKFGIPAEEAQKLHLQQVSLTASVLSTGEDSMLEVVGDITILDSPPATASPLAETTVDGVCVIRGEIVDSKCWFGAMNPGTFKPHRACAIHCIRGGIPVGLLASDAAGNREYFLLTGPEGEALNDVILDFVAEPIEVSGTLSYAGTLPVLKIDPGQIIRLYGGEG